jgi:hypothetical protein
MSCFRVVTIINTIAALTSLLSFSAPPENYASQGRPGGILKKPSYYPPTVTTAVYVLLLL